MSECQRCSTTFTSRNKLFVHLKTCGVITPDSDRHVFTTVRNLTAIPEPSSDDPGKIICVAGGRIRGRTLSCAEIYFPLENRWAAAPNMADARGSHGAAGIGDKIYVVGGGGYHSNLSSCEGTHIATHSHSNLT
jgi:hypothetical protein